MDPTQEWQQKHSDPARCTAVKAPKQRIYRYAKKKMLMNEAQLALPSQFE